MTTARNYLIAIVFLLCLALVFYLAFDNAYAAPATEDLNVPPCEAINSAGVIVIYRCTPNEGPTYLINSVGFLWVEE